MSEVMTEAEARYIQRLPAQFEGALRKVLAYKRAQERYCIPLEREAQRLLREIYGDENPGAVAEEKFQREWRA